jgi:hypothetical protein
MRRRFVLFVAIFASLGMLPLAAEAGERVWSGLVVATNRPGAIRMPLVGPGPPRPMRRFHRTLQRTFGYNQFEIIGESRKTLRTGQEDWLAASKHFSLHVDTRGTTRDGGYRVHLQLFQDRQTLLETDATLSASSPLVIRGPQIGAGQLLLLLVVQ